MKKAVVVSLILFVFPLFCFSSVWFQSQQDTGSYATLNVLNLEDPLFLPIRSTDFSNTTYSSEQLQGMQATGVNSNNNYVGKVVVEKTSQPTTITITTLNNGRFVSSSDPTKYRDFFIAVNPRQKNRIGTTSNYYESDSVQNSDRMPNTRDINQVSITLPSASNGILGLFATSYWIDILVCMDELTSNDLHHMTETDDYYASFLVEWSGGGEGSAIVNLRGYYGDENVLDTSSDSVYLTVIPRAEATNLNIIDAIANATSIPIADISVSTTPAQTSNTWNGKVYTFVSPSSDYTEAVADGFVLVNSRNGNTIPYTITISDGSTSKTFNGSSNYSSLKSNGCIKSGTPQKTTDSFYVYSFSGVVSITISNPTDVIVSDNVYNAENPNSDYYGEYESYVYYHVVYDT